MTFIAAFRYYLLLLALFVFAAILLLPSSLKLDFGKKNLCRIAGLSYEQQCANWPIAIKIPYTVQRPNLSVSLFGKTYSRDLEYRYGLDIVGGSEVVMLVNMDAIAPADRDRALESARDVITRRIDLYGLLESTVKTGRSGTTYRLIATIPGITESDTVSSLIGSTASLDFRELSMSAATRSASVASASGYQVTDFVRTTLSGKDLARANVLLDNQTSRPVIGLEFSPEGTEKFAALTKRNIGKPIAIFLDEYPINAPTVQNVITDGRAQITGNFTTDEAQKIASTLNAGNLPAPISVLSQRTVEATLGSDHINASVQSGVIGVLFVIVFIIALYGGVGIIGAVALLYYGVITLALYKLIPITLSLPSIAGFLLSIGMAVDTLILVFERLREEEGEGDRPAALILARAFGRTWGSIKDANGVTLISCFVLANPLDWPFLNSSGMIRGFAFTLALGILVNLFSGMIVLRVLMRLFYRKKQ